MADPIPISDRLSSGAFIGLMRAARLLPYERRIPAMGRLFTHVIAPAAGWRQRIRTNLAHALPELSEAEIAGIIRDVTDNAGRSLAETYSGKEFTDRINRAPVIEGPGLAALQQAHAEGRSVIIASAHFGNYDAMRATLVAQGWPFGGLYRPMNNEAFNRHYIPTLESISGPIFPRGRAGLGAMLRYLRGGGWLVLGFDQYDQNGADLRFFGQPTRTVLTPAELALRHEALLIPANAIRQPDGLSFRVRAGAPIPHSDAPQMMQALNDDLEALIRQHMGQWFWVHRRWK